MAETFPCSRHGTLSRGGGRDLRGNSNLLSVHLQLPGCIGDRAALWRTDTAVVSTAHVRAVSTDFGEAARFGTFLRMQQFGGGRCQRPSPSSSWAYVVRSWLVLS
jgi:hypothetical protein